MFDPNFRFKVTTHFNFLEGDVAKIEVQMKKWWWFTWCTLNDYTCLFPYKDVGEIQLKIHEMEDAIMQLGEEILDNEI